MTSLEVHSGTHIFVPCAGSQCSSGGEYNGEYSGSADDIWGYTIFDAIEGDPGFYIYYDQYGHMSWGFSESLWSATLSEIDNIRAGTESHDNPDAGNYPWTGFQVYVTYSGAGNEQISGTIPDYAQAVAEAAYWSGKAAPYITGLPNGVLLHAQFITECTTDGNKPNACNSGAAAASNSRQLARLHGTMTFAAEFRRMAH